MQTSQVSRSSAGGSEQDTSAVRAPRACARASAARTKGVVPLAAMPTTTSLRPDPAGVHLADAGVDVVLRAFDRRTSAGQPAGDDARPPSRAACRTSAGTRRRRARRAGRWCPRRRRAAGRRRGTPPPPDRWPARSPRAPRATAPGTVASSAPMRSTISSAEAVSMVALRGLRRSVRRVSRKSSATHGDDRSIQASASALN